MFVPGRQAWRSHSALMIGEAVYFAPRLLPRPSLRPAAATIPADRLFAAWAVMPASLGGRSGPRAASLV